MKSLQLTQKQSNELNAEENVEANNHIQSSLEMTRDSLLKSLIPSFNISVKGFDEYAIKFGNIAFASLI